MEWKIEHGITEESLKIAREKIEEFEKKNGIKLRKSNNMKKYVVQENIKKKFKRYHYDQKIKNILLKYMRSFDDGPVGDMVYDYVKDDDTGIEEVWYEDDQYNWSTEDIYYFENYDLLISEDFVKHVLNKEGNNK